MGCSLRSRERGDWVRAHTRVGVFLHVPAVDVRPAGVKHQQLQSAYENTAATHYSLKAGRSGRAAPARAPASHDMARGARLFPSRSNDALCYDRRRPMLAPVPEDATTDSSVDGALPVSPGLTAPAPLAWPGAPRCVHNDAIEHTHTHTHAHACAHTHTHTHTHAHIRTLLDST